MNVNITLLRSPFTISILGIALSILMLTLFLQFAPSGSHSDGVTVALAAPAAFPAPASQAGSGLPVRLKIPRINLNAPVKYVSLTPQGAMDVPRGPADVAWFNLGPRPGEKGSAVIAGHYGWKNNTPAVFDNLSKLRKGDKVYVANKNGADTTFVVREVRVYGENDDASAVFGTSDGKAHLNLVTCGGTWNKGKKSYSNRLVVFTDKE